MKDILMYKLIQAVDMTISPSYYEDDIVQQNSVLHAREVAEIPKKYIGKRYLTWIVRDNSYLSQGQIDRYRGMRPEEEDPCERLDVDIKTMHIEHEDKMYECFYGYAYKFEAYATIHLFLYHIPDEPLTNRSEK